MEHLHWSGDCDSLICIGGDDDGGNNITSTITFVPIIDATFFAYVDADTAIIRFTQFDIADSLEFVQIYDDTTLIAELNNFNFTDSVFEASDANHCLTIVFSSNHSI